MLTFRFPHLLISSCTCKEKKSLITPSTIPSPFLICIVIIALFEKINRSKNYFICFMVKFWSKELSKSYSPFSLITQFSIKLSQLLSYESSEEISCFIVFIIHNNINQYRETFYSFLITCVSLTFRSSIPLIKNNCWSISLLNFKKSYPLGYSSDIFIFLQKRLERFGSIRIVHVSYIDDIKELSLIFLLQSPF